MTEKKIKDIIGIEEWSELENPEQFSLLLANYHMLSKGVRTKVLSKLSDFRALTSMFYDNLADTFVAYEPTVIMMFDPLIKIMDLIMDSSGGKPSKEDKEFIAEVFRSFSEWYATEEGILLQTESFDDMCTADEAYNLLRCIDRGELRFAHMDMMLMTLERNEFLKHAEKDAMDKYSIDVDFLRNILGRDPDQDILEKNFRKYIN